MSAQPPSDRKEKLSGRSQGGRKSREKAKTSSEEEEKKEKRVGRSDLFARSRLKSG